MKKRPIIIKEEKEETPPPYELREVGKPYNEVGSLVYSLIKDDLISNEFEEVVFLYTQNKKATTTSREGFVTIWTNENELQDEKGKTHKVNCKGEIILTIARDIDLDILSLSQKWREGLRESGITQSDSPKYVDKFGSDFVSVALSFEWGERLELRPSFVPIDQETDQETQLRRNALINIFLMSVYC